MKNLLILIITYLSSCNVGESNLERKCKRLDSNTIEFLFINKKYNNGDTIMYKSGDKENKYIIVDEPIKLKR